MPRTVMDVALCEIKYIVILLLTWYVGEVHGDNGCRLSHGRTCHSQHKMQKHITFLLDVKGTPCAMFLWFIYNWSDFA